MKSRYKKELKLPKPLFPGQKVAIVAPASPTPTPKSVDLAVAAVEALGFRVELGKNARKRFGYFAGTDKERASDLMNAFLNPKVEGIFCLRGGYGAARILPLLDFGAIRKNPKALIGYSDVTALHCALYECAGLASYHGPVATSLIDEKNRGAVKNLLAAVSMRDDEREVLSSKGKHYSLHSGNAKGRLLGGNLSILTSLVGTKFFPNLSGSILFLEDVGEPPYRIDRYITQLISSGVLKGIKGVVLGQFTKCEDKHLRMKKDNRPDVNDVLAERFSNFNVPIYRNANLGHIKNNTTIPVGFPSTLKVSSSKSLLTVKR